MTQIARTRSLPKIPIVKPLKVPEFKSGDIIKFSYGDGKTHKYVVSMFDQAKGHVSLVSVIPRRRFSEEVRLRLEAGEVDYDYSKTPESLLPCTFDRSIYFPLDG